MAHVSVKVHNRNYAVACEDGEEARLVALAAGLDSRMQDLAQTVGPVGEARMLLMTSLLLSDELATQVGREDAIADALDAATARIEQLTRRIAGSESV